MKNTSTIWTAVRMYLPDILLMVFSGLPILFEVGPAFNDLTHVLLDIWPELFEIDSVNPLHDSVHPYFCVKLVFGELFYLGCVTLGRHL